MSYVYLTAHTRSVVKVIRCDLDHIFRFEVYTDEGFPTIFLLILIHVVDLLDASLFDDLRAAETGVVGRVEPTAFGLADADLNYGGLFGMQAEALVQLLSLVVVATLTAHTVA